MKTTLDQLADSARSSGDRAELLRYLRQRREKVSERMPFTGSTPDSGRELPSDAENLADIVGIVAPYETPLLDHIGDTREPAVSTLHEWEDSGGRRGNPTQLFTAGVDVSGSLQASRAYGIADEADYQKQERLRELLRDLENCVINGVYAPPSLHVRVRRNMNGIVALVRTNRISVDGPLNADLLNDSIGQANSELGSHIDTIVVGGAQKRRINSFATVRAHLPDDQTYSDMISVYQSNHGACRVVMSRWVPSDTVLLLDSTRISVKPLKGRSFHYKALAATAGSISGQLVGEYTLELRDERAHGIITGLEVK